MKTSLLSRNRSLLILVGLAPLLAFAGCSQGPQAASPSDVAAFNGDASKMPAADRARMLEAQRRGAAAATQSRPPVQK